MPRQAANKPLETNKSLKEKAIDVYNQQGPITETVRLISRGLMPEIPSEVVIKAVQRKDRKKLLISETEDPLLFLLQSCIVSPKEFNVFDLLPFESKYLLYRLRILTYGTNHTFNDKCPYCGHLNSVDINLNDIPIVDLPDDFKTSFDVQLPVSGDVLTLKMLTEGEISIINKKAKEFENNIGVKSSFSDMLWEARVIAINGNSKLAPIEKTRYLDEMNDYDSEYFMEYYLKHSGDYGLQDKLHYECDSCHSVVNSEMPSIYTFFRPTFKIN